MPRLTLRVSGLDTVRYRLQATRAALGPALYQAAQQIAADAVARLAEAAPAGGIESSGPPPGGDAEGRLKDSFVVDSEGDGSGGSAFTVMVRTTQPTKLHYVRRGRGQVLPLRPAYALFWPGLDHPVMRSGPSVANDFVTPVLAEVHAGAGEFARAAVGEAISGE